jgi:hypothetical protein
MVDQLDEAQYWAAAGIVCALAAGTIHVDEVERLLGLADRRGTIPPDAAAGFGSTSQNRVLAGTRRLRLVEDPDDEAD